LVIKQINKTKGNGQIDEHTICNWSMQLKQAKYFSENGKGKIVQLSFCIHKKIRNVDCKIFLESSSKQHEVVKVKSTYFGLADIL
jgi:hypothetical protein